jgi:tRNA pseudouridine38-40 synthase
VRLLLEIAYHGAGLNGWQSQAGGNTVQDFLESAFHALGEREVSIHGSGRTDAGVHANAQQAHVDVTAGRFTPREWLAALNAHLPSSIRVMGIREVSEDFHARFSAIGKIYTYTIWNAPMTHPMLDDRSWHVPWKLDPASIRTACSLFEGTHDFAAFSARRTKEPEHTTRTIHRIDAHFDGPKIELRFEGGGFLYKMVRILTAAIVRHSAGRCALEELSAKLREGTPAFCHTAPAQGLRLEKVLYPSA